MIKLLSFVFISALLVGCASPRIPVSPDYTLDNHTQLEYKKALLAEFKQWQQTPYKFGGNTKRGIDCSAYMQHTYQEVFNIELPRTAKAQAKVGKLIPYQKMQVGDLIFFRPDTYPAHVGVYLGDGTFIHVSSKKGVTRSEISNGYWLKHFRYAKRIVNS